MSFYVALHGTDSNFNTKLDQPLILNSDYEVTLSDISLNGNFLINYGTINVQSNNVNAYFLNIRQIEIEIILEDNLTIENFVKKINFILCHKIRFVLWSKITRNTSIRDFVYDHNINENTIIFLHHNQIYSTIFDGYKIIDIQGYMKKYFDLEKV